MASRQHTGSMRRRYAVGLAATAIALLVAACGGSSGGSSSSSSGAASGAATGNAATITLWHGYAQASAGEEPSAEYDSLKAQVDAFMKANPNVKVDMTYVNSDEALQKLTVALQGGKAPDVTYQYGTNLPQLATSSSVVDLTDKVGDADYNWNDFPAGERDVFTIDGKVYGVPALVDNLAVVYNKTLFDEANLEYPNADWTWDDLRAAAKALTDPAKKQFGFSYPMDASEDSVWHYEPLLWQNGGSILNEDNTQAAFNSPEGVEALDVLAGMAVDDKSVFLDLQNSPYTGLFNSGKIGMLETGPWDLASFPDVDYGVEILPGFNGDHQTIAGPDMWTVFDNGGGRAQACVSLRE